MSGIFEFVAEAVLTGLWFFGCYGVGRGVLAVVSAGRMTSSLSGEAPPGPEDSRSRYVDPDMVRLIGLATIVLAIVACVLIATFVKRTT